MRLRVSGFLGMSLPTTGVVIGYIYVVISMILTVFYMVELNDLKQYKDEVLYVMENKTIYSNVTLDRFHEIVSYYNDEIFRSWAVLFGCFMWFFFSVLLIHGTKTNSYKLILPWLIFSAIALIRFVVAFFIIITHDPFAEASAASLIIVGIKIWVWVAIFSLYANISEGNYIDPNKSMV